MNGTNILHGITAFIIRREETWIINVEMPREWSWDRYLLNCLAGVAFPQLSICVLICLWPWWRSVCLWATEHFLPFLAAIHLCQDHMLLMCFSSTYRTVQDVYYYSRQFHCTKLGQFTIFRATKRQCCHQHCFLQEGDDEAVGIEWSHGVQKRIIKTKQWWHIWNLRTLLGRNEVYQSQAVSGMNGSSLPGVPLWMWWAGQKMEISRAFFLLLELKAETYRKPSPAFLGEAIFNENSADQLGQSCSWLSWINCVLVYRG